MYLILEVFQKETHRLTSLWLLGEGWGQGEGRVREFGVAVYILLYLKWITSKDLLYKHKELCSMLFGSLDGRGVWRRMYICICMAETLCCLPETITTLFANLLYPNSKKKKLKNLLEDSRVSKAVMFTPRISGNMNPFMLNWWLLKTVNFTKWMWHYTKFYQSYRSPVVLYINGDWNVALESYNSGYPCHYRHFIPFPFQTFTEIYYRLVKKKVLNSQNIFRPSLPLLKSHWKI